MISPGQSSSPPSSFASRALVFATAAVTAAVFGVIAWLLARQPPSTAPSAGVLPTLNATLNATTTVCLILGWRAIRRRDIARHRAWMVTSLVLSSLFLVFYVVHHYQVGSVRFVGPPWLRALYLGVLLPHVVLAAVMVPFVLVTVTRAFQGDFERHRRVARWTLPMWLVVSVTGVLVYWMLYHWSTTFS